MGLNLLLVSAPRALVQDTLQSQADGDSGHAWFWLHILLLLYHSWHHHYPVSGSLHCIFLFHFYLGPHTPTNDRKLTKILWDRFLLKHIHPCFVWTYSNVHTEQRRRRPGLQHQGYIFLYRFVFLRQQDHLFPFISQGEVDTYCHALYREEILSSKNMYF